MMREVRTERDLPALVHLSKILQRPRLTLGVSDYIWDYHMGDGVQPLEPSASVFPGMSAGA